MAKEKEDESIIGLGNDENNLLVQKVKPLYDLLKSDLTLGEFKILDTYLGRINSYDEGHRKVVLSKGEVEKALDVTQINGAVLAKRLDNLMSSRVKFPDENAKNGFSIINLFERADAIQDKNGLWTVTIKCTEEAKKVFFNIDKIGYYKYKLRCIKSITSKPTYIMFNYLELNRFRKEWDADVDELKKLLNCDNQKTYEKFKYFNDLVLKKIQKDIHGTTECRYSYTPIKKGKYVVKVHFILETLKDFDEESKPEEPVIIESNHKNLWKEVLEEFNFNNEQYEEIRSLLVNVPNYKFPEDITTGCDDLTFRWYHYLKIKIAEIKRRDKNKPIKHKYGYLIKLIKQDVIEYEGSSYSNVSSNNFNNYGGRDYSKRFYELLEIQNTRDLTPEEMEELKRLS